jgi:hypothetical protein
MKMNKGFFLMGAAMAILVTAVSQLIETFAQQDPDVTFGEQETNMTGLERKLKSVQPEGGLMKSAAPGDFVYVLVCPPDFGNVVEDCQIFQGSPIQ